MTVALFVVAAAIGAVVRAVATDLDALFNRRMLGTAAVNIVGSFLLGVVSGSSANTAAILGVGALGALTTFSTYISQVECIHREDSTFHAALYCVGSIVAGVGAAYAGWLL